jgi:hypothetical protein
VKSRPTHPAVAVANAQSALDRVAAALNSPPAGMTPEYAVECAKQLQAAAYSLFNLARNRAAHQEAA